jgi:hypothetical protein
MISARCKEVARGRPVPALATREVARSNLSALAKPAPRISSSSSPATEDVRGYSTCTRLSDRIPCEISSPSSYDSPGAAASSDSVKVHPAPQKPGWDIGGTLKGMLLLNLGAFLFGSNQVVIKTTEEALSPIALDALRFGIAALCFVPLLPRAFKQQAMLLPALELGVWLTGVHAVLSSDRSCWMSLEILARDFCSRFSLEIFPRDSR